MKCILCGNKAFKTLYLVEEYQILMCTNCELVTTKQSDTLSYTHYHRDADYEKFEKHFKNIFRKRFNLVKKYLNINKSTNYTPRVCDIGASTGTMLDIFSKEGWETWGVEPSKSAGLAKSKGHKIIKSTLEKAKVPSKYFDAVVLNHTLEHVDNPLVVLKKVRDILKDRGIVLVDVPNFGSLSSALQKEKWSYLLPQEHNFHFTQKTLKAIFEKAGFDVIYSKSRSGICEFANPLEELLESLISLKKRFFTNVVGLPQSLIETTLNKGNSMSMIGTKHINK